MAMDYEDRVILHEFMRETNREITILWSRLEKLEGIVGQMRTENQKLEEELANVRRDVLR